MKYMYLKKNVPIILMALLIAAFVYTGALIIRNSNLSLRNTDNSNAQSASCTQSDLDSFQITQPTPSIGDTFTKDCVASGKQIYSDDTRFSFFDIPGGLLPAGKPYIRTKNVATKNNTSNYTWGINVTNSAGAYVYIYQRRSLDPSSLLSWMNTSNRRFVKTSPDAFNSSQLNQFLLRKNTSNLTGLYDVYRTETLVTGQITLGPASTASDNALSMYIAAVVPQSAGQPTSPPNNPTSPPGNQPTFPPGSGSITATIETVPVPHGGDAADDPAIWVNPSNPAGSLVLGTDKAGGGIRVYNLSGAEINKAGDGKALNNVDIRNGFNLGGQSITIAAASDRNTRTIAIYRLNADGSMVDIGSGTLRTSFEPYGFCLYKSNTGKLYAIMTANNSGTVQQYELVANSSGKVDAVQVTRSVPFSGSGKIGSQSEGCAADDELGFVYIGEESKGIWKFGAEPNSSTNPSAPTMPTGSNLKADVEGVSIVKTGSGAGYIFASSQGDSTFSIYRRDNNAFVKKFSVASGVVDEVTGSDGIDTIFANMGPGFPFGMFATQDTSNGGGGNQNFKYVQLERILGGLSGSATNPTSPPVAQATQPPSNNGRPPIPAAMLAEVQKHTDFKNNNCWMAFYSTSTDANFSGWHLYNISPYFGLHPKEKDFLDPNGDDKRLIYACGKDATDVLLAGASNQSVSGLGNAKHSGGNLASGDLKPLSKFKVANW